MNELEQIMWNFYEVFPGSYKQLPQLDNEGNIHSLEVETQINGFFAHFDLSQFPADSWTVNVTHHPALDSGEVLMPAKTFQAAMVGVAILTEFSDVVRKLQTGPSLPVGRLVSQLPGVGIELSARALAYAEQWCPYLQSNNH